MIRHPETVNDITILGACVTQFMREALFPNAGKRRIVWRVSTPSLMSPAPSISELPNLKMSEKEAITFNHDFQKTFDIESKAKLSDIVLMDFIRDTYDFHLFPDGAVTTRGPEWGANGIDKQIEGEIKFERVKFGTKKHFELWLDGIKKFSEKISRPIVFTRAFQTAFHAGPNPGMVKSNVQQDIRINFALHHYYRIFLGLRPDAIALDLPQYALFADPDHPWGPKSMHYRSEVYKAGASNYKFAVREASIRADNPRSTALCEELMYESIEAMLNTHILKQEIPV